MELKEKAQKELNKLTSERLTRFMSHLLANKMAINLEFKAQLEKIDNIIDRIDQNEKDIIENVSVFEGGDYYAAVKKYLKLNQKEL